MPRKKIDKLQRQSERWQQLQEAVFTLWVRERITHPQFVAPGVWACSHTGHGWGQVAYDLACQLPGQIWPGRKGCSWVCNGLAGQLIDIDDVPDLRHATDTLADLGIREEEYWSMGRAARALLGWVADPATCPVNNDVLLDGIEIGYHDCQPGVYECATMYDCKSYYFRLLERLPSLRVIATKDALIWDQMTPCEKARWKDALQAVEGCKVLRNSLVGCAMGASGKTLAYKRDPERPGRAVAFQLRLPGGPFRGAGLLIIRSAYELCQLASLQTDSVYSTIDSVVTESSLRPKVWEDLGLQVERKAGGLAVICRRGCWKVGPKETLPYKAGYRLSVPVSRAETPHTQYWRQWLQ